MSPTEQVASLYGKQLVPLVAQLQKPHTNQGQVGSTGSQYQAQAKGRAKQAPRARTSAQAPVQIKPIQRENQQQAKCKGLSLQEFKGISLDQNEIVIRDVEGQPIYLMSICGYLRQSDGLFLPLNGLRDKQHLIKANLGPKSEKPLARPPLNCTFSYAGMSTGGASDGLSLSQRGNRPFTEEITIFFDCGYLILLSNGDNNYLELESLSLYGEVLARSAREPVNSNLHKRTRQLFTSNFSPLLMIPQSARYTCKNRIALAGTNQSVLVLDELELFRLPVAAAYGSFVVAAISAQPASTSAPQQTLVGLSKQLERQQPPVSQETVPSGSVTDGNKTEEAERYPSRKRRSAQLKLADHRSLGE